MLAADVSAWLRPDAPTSPDRLFCHTYGRSRKQAQMIPGWPYSVIAAIEEGASRPRVCTAVTMEDGSRRTTMTTDRPR